MKVELTGRHLEITPPIREHVEAQIGKLDLFFKNAETAQAHVIIAVEKNRQIAEVVFNWREHTLTATETDKDLYVAVTKAFDKLNKQVRRLKDKVVNRKHLAKPAAEVAPAPEDPVSAEPLPPRIIPVENLTLKPMTAEEAVLNLSDSNLFMVFLDAESDRTSVVYKRHDGNYGLIQP